MGEVQTFLGIIYHNENDGDGTKKALQELQKLQPYVLEERVNGVQPVVGDQLTVERDVHCIMGLRNDFTPEECRDHSSFGHSLLIQL